MTCRYRAKALRVVLAIAVVSSACDGDDEERPCEIGLADVPGGDVGDVVSCGLEDVPEGGFTSR